MPHPRMDPAEDLSKALALLGLQDLPRDPAELSRQVTHRYPATAVWGAEQSWAYRVVWNRCTPATGGNEHRPGQR